MPAVKLLDIEIEKKLNIVGKTILTDINMNGTMSIDNEPFLSDKKPTTQATVIDYATYNNYDVTPLQDVNMGIVEYKKLHRMNIVYFPDSNDTYDFSLLPAHKLTHIILGFGFANWTQADYDTATDGGTFTKPLVYGGDYDNTVAEGILQFRYTDKFNSNLAKLKGVRKKYPHLKVCLSLGGGKMSWNFSKVLGSISKRTNFVNSIVGYMVREGLDEINVDWEYPRFAAHQYSLFNLEYDLANYAKFLGELRTLMNTASPDKYIPITVATGNYEGVINDFIGMNALIDYYYIMTYDYAGTTWNEANPHTPLEDNGMNDNRYARKAAELMNTVAKIPKDKILIGAASYGWGWQIVDKTGVNGFYGDVDDADNPTLPDDFSGGIATGVEIYSKIVNEGNTNPDYSVVYDAGSVSVSLQKDNLDGTHEIWTYDNETTVGLKAQFVNDEDLGGMINWNLTGDTLDGTSLVNAAYEKFLENDNFFVSVLAGDNNKMSINKQGWLGLGVQNPQEKLDVGGGAIINGDCNIKGDIVIDGGFVSTSGTIFLEADAPGITLSNTTETESGITFQDSSAPATQQFHINFNAQSQELIIKSDSDTALTITPDGVVQVTSAIQFTSLGSHPADTTNKLYCKGGKIFFDGLELAKVLI